jgi:hypothetical protein
MNNTVTIEVPPEVMAEAERILSDLPRKRWPVGDTYTLATGWELITGLGPEKKRTAGLVHTVGRIAAIAHRWEDIK